MLMLTFDWLLNEYKTKNEAMSSTDLERIGSGVSIIPFAVAMRDEVPETISEDNVKNFC